MGYKIHIPATGVWEYYLKNIMDLQKTEHIIAANDDNIAVVLTRQPETGLHAIVYLGADTVLRDITINTRDASTNMVKMLYTQYITPSSMQQSEKSDKKPAEKPAEKTEEPKDKPAEKTDSNDLEVDEICKREDELMDALLDFLAILIQAKSHAEVLKEFDKGYPDELLDDICMHLWADQALSVYRPTFAKDPESGLEFYTEYPYEDPDCEAGS